MSKFTPGPWEAQLEAVRFVIQVDGVIGKRALAVTAGSEPANPFNAYLIAAAPELYDALTGLLVPLEQVSADLKANGSALNEVAETFIVRAQAALAKARGE